MPRPTADVKVGDVLTATAAITNRTIHMTVTKVGRAWITACAPVWGEGRFRIDTQRTGDQRLRFQTEDQAAWDERVAQAQHVLRDHRITVESRARVDDDLLIALAGFLTTWEIEHAKGGES
jgi:hypothetical protein